ncbi:hypothetical protein PRIPAC_91913 [Pristionchus pacificus]|uniref:Uncharacterized protein n=1 Tax=Pristionchus pacificus TaxID=54126 RepID=A0A2A6CI96_PRIPA|nr:hypothetical protein PRIPAC_91913 [Pristionchus pacificus]|eukprot:PDM77810.1 hypothetical protein PRIPAC_34677 [Pristionchus pacificus]
MDVYFFYNYCTDQFPEWGDGLSELKCFCDPTEATLNDHEPAPLPKKKCVEHHVFNETTQSCECMKHDPKYCGELITNDGRRQMIEIPNWPSNKKYYVDHWNNATKRAENFHITITEVIVRQHCFATMLNARYPQDTQYLLLEFAGYDRQEVRSYYNGKLNSPEQGTKFVMMNLLFAIGLLFRSIEARFANSPIAHLSDSMKLKCDALPYRTAFVESQCYFTVTEELEFDEGASKCASLFPGARVATKIPDSIFNAMMLDKSKFHSDRDSSGAKRLVCIYESGFACQEGSEQSPFFPGKCIVSDSTKRKYLEAQLIKNPCGSETSVRQASGTDRPLSPNNRRIASQIGAACRKPLSSVVDKSGYWAAAGQEYQFGTVCVKDAENDFNRGSKKPAKPTRAPEKIPCKPLHAFDEDTGLCEWTGPDDACAQMIDYKNESLWVSMRNFPAETHTALVLPEILNRRWNDVISRVIVRRGCMYSGFGGNIHTFERIVMGKNNLEYGEHRIPCYAFGDGLSCWGDGLSFLQCFCDPTEATLNNHVPAPPPDKEYIEHHVFDEETQHLSVFNLSGKHDSKFCGELITNDGRRKMIEIPDWPTNQKYHYDHWENLTLRRENFHITVTEIIVRQHCWATLLNSYYNYKTATLMPSGYGRHQVKSFYTGHLNSPEQGTHIVMCECMNPERRPYTGNREKGTAQFGQEASLAQSVVCKISNSNPARAAWWILEGTRFHDIVSKVVVRQGCMYSGFGGNKIVMGKNNLGYGQQWVPCFAYGGLGPFLDGLSEWGDGLSILKCFCDPTEATLNDHEPAPPRKHDPKFCGELITNDGRRQMIEIPDYPSNKKYDFDHWENTTKRAENFHVTVTEIIVRQHCWASLYNLPYGRASYINLELAGYGRHEVASYYNGKLTSPSHFTHTVICECLH